MQDPNRNTQTIRCLYEDVLSNHRLEQASALFGPELPGGASGFQTLAGELIRAFPDIRYTVLELVAEGDRVAVRWQWTGTHAGPFRGFEPTHKSVTDAGMAIFTFSGARIAGVALQTDRLGLLQQLGVVPSDRALRVPAPVLDTARAPAGVYLVDTFRVPAAARAEFEAAMRRNREYIRTLDGFRGDAVLRRKQGDGFDIATIAVWDTPAAIARAKEQVAEFYQRIGFDMPSTIARWGVELERTICEAPAELK
jgi:predicted ester cyclase